MVEIEMKDSVIFIGKSLKKFNCHAFLLQLYHFFHNINSNASPFENVH